MSLTPEQQKTVEQWVKDGLGLSDIQKRLLADLSVTMTYMDVRLLILELGLKIQEKKATTPVSAADVSAPAAGAGADQAPGGLSRVSVDVDRVMRPGSLASGTVKFSDGTTVKWMLDEMGRLALDAGKKRYTPSREDVEAFQVELRKVLEKQGF